MIKTYVVDTNVLIQAPYAVQCFEDNHVVLPVVVLEELDNLKKAEGEKGANARKAIRLLENLRRKGDLLTAPPGRRARSGKRMPLGRTAQVRRKIR